MKALYSVIYEDDSLLALNKTSGIPVINERWQAGETLKSVIEKDFARRFFVCHRLDKDTSGVIIFAKTAEAHGALQKAFEKRQVKKKYIAILQGLPEWDETRCSLSLVPNGNKKHETVVDKFRGKPSVTLFRKVLSAYSMTLAEAYPETGRTHQIRVHAASLGYPVVCDRIYAKNAEAVYLSRIKPAWRGDKYEERPLLSRLALHAASLTLPRGIAGKDELCLDALLSKDMAALINQMRRLR